MKILLGGSSMKINISEELHFDELEFNDGSEAKEDAEKEAEKNAKETQKEIDQKIKDVGSAQGCTGSVPRGHCSGPQKEVPR